MSNAFEYGDALLPQFEPPASEAPAQAGSESGSQPVGSNQPYLNLATYVALSSGRLKTHY